MDMIKPEDMTDWERIEFCPLKIANYDIRKITDTFKDSYCHACKKSGVSDTIENANKPGTRTLFCPSCIAKYNIYSEDNQLQKKGIALMKMQGYLEDE